MSASSARESIQVKNAFYFSHDSNARNDQKIIRLRMKHGAEGYGIYFMLIEQMVESSDYSLSTDYLSLAFNMRVDEELLRSVVEDFGLFEFSKDKQSFYSQSLVERMKPLEDIREKRRQAGLRSAEVKRARKLEMEKAQQKFNTCSTPVAKNSTEESRVEQSKEEQSRVKESKAEESRAEQTFSPPTPADVSVYCKERNNTVDAQRFVSFYESKGWMVGRNKMKDWRAAVRSWERLENPKRQTRAPNIAQQVNSIRYEQF